MRKTKTNPDKIYNICSICVADAGMEDDALVKWLSEIILNDFERNNIPWNCDIIDSLIDAWKMSANREMAAQAEELYEECEKYRNFMKALLQLTKTFNSESLSSIEINEDQNKVSNEVTTPKKERTANKDTKKIANDKGKNFREQDFPLMSM